MKKILLGLTPFAMTGMALAAEGDGVNITADASSVASAVADWAGTLTPVVLSVVGAFLGFWAIKVGIRIIKGVASTSK